MARYMTVLFDIDGVMLSEERYFDASALCVWELLTSPQYLALPVATLPAFHADVTEAEIRSIRTVVFADDLVLRAIKSRGVNANWDMVYLQTAYQLTRVLERANQLGHGELLRANTVPAGDGWTAQRLQALSAVWRDGNLQDELAAAVSFAHFATACAHVETRASLIAWLRQRLHTCSTVTPAEDELSQADVDPLWMVGQQAFQEWYLGDKYTIAPRQTGKRGFLADEIPLADPAVVATMLDQLRAHGVALGIATGRPRIETEVPLQSLGWLDKFAADRITTASDVLAAQQSLGATAPSLGKPHPYSYLRSYLHSPSAQAVLGQPLPLAVDEANRVLVVGDSLADLLAARAVGCHFAAVLTGLEGEAARTLFEDYGAHHILSDVLAVAGLVLGQQP